MTSPRREEGNSRPLFDSNAATLEDLHDLGKAVRSACRKVASLKADSHAAEIRDAKTLGRVVDWFFTETEENRFPELSDLLRDRTEYIREISELKEEMISFRRDTIASATKNNSAAKDKLRISAAAVARRMDNVIVSYRAIVTELARGEIRDKAFDIADNADDELAGYGHTYPEKIKESLRESGGMSGSAVLGAFFSDRAAVERKTANRLRIIVVVLLVMIAGWAILILFLPPLKADTLEQTLARLSTTLPLAVLAGYLGKESSRHRSAAEQAGELGAHLRSLDDYVAKLSAAEGRRYRYELGQRAYTIVNKRSAGETSAPGLAEEAARLAETLKGVFRS